MSINLENMTAVQNENQEGILGHLMWYSVGKQLIKTDELKNKLIQSGLEEAWMPNAIRPADAFRRATKEIETRKATANAGVFENYLIREVFADKDYVQRNIVVESVNQAGKRLDYNSKAGVITLDKKNESITFVSENETAKVLDKFSKEKGPSAVRFVDFMSIKHCSLVYSFLVAFGWTINNPKFPVVNKAGRLALQ